MHSSVHASPGLFKIRKCNIIHMHQIFKSQLIKELMPLWCPSVNSSACWPELMWIERIYIIQILQGCIIIASMYIYLLQDNPVICNLVTRLLQPCNQLKTATIPRLFQGCNKVVKHIVSRLLQGCNHLVFSIWVILSNGFHAYA